MLLVVLMVLVVVLLVLLLVLLLVVVLVVCQFRHQRRQFIIRCMLFCPRELVVHVANTVIEITSGFVL